MKTYWNSLNDTEREFVEEALDTLTALMDGQFAVKLAGDDRSSRAAEALAAYIMESKQ